MQLQGGLDTSNLQTKPSSEDTPSKTEIIQQEEKPKTPPKPQKRGVSFSQDSPAERKRGVSSSENQPTERKRGVSFCDDSPAESKVEDSNGSQDGTKSKELDQQKRKMSNDAEKKVKTDKAPQGRGKPLQGSGKVAKGNTSQERGRTNVEQKTTNSKISKEENNSQNGADDKTVCISCHNSYVKLQFCRLLANIYKC